MTSADYEVVFEIATSGPGELTFVLPGLLFVGIGLAAYRYRKSLLRTSPFLSGKAFATLLLGFSVLWTATAGIGILAVQSSARSDYAAGNFEVTEGGPIRSGLAVRISHRGNLILELEVARSARADGA